MKKHWIIFILPAIMMACNTSTVKEKPFTVQGEITAYESGMIYLLKREKAQFITLDSTMVNEARFVFNGEIDYPRFTFLKLDGQQNYIPFFLEPGEIELKVNIDELGNPEVKGSESHAIYQAFMDKNKLYNEKMSDLYAAYLEARKEENQELMKDLQQQYDNLEQEKKDYLTGYIMDNSGSPVAALIALRNLYLLGLDELIEITEKLDNAISGSSYVVDLNERLTRLKNVQIGNPAPDFILNDTIGNPVALSSLFGNYLLVDFWASWCGPCRRENPNIVAAYQKYHDKGFSVLGVSLDTDRDRWIKAIHDDNLSWHHVSDLSGWSNETVALYAVNSIPSSVLLDPNGVIIARNLKEEALHNKLEEIFGSGLAAE